MGMFQLNHQTIYHSIWLTGYLDEIDNEKQKKPPTILTLLVCSYCA